MTGASEHAAQARDPKPTPEPVRRSSEIEDPTNLYLIHPISAWLVPFFERAEITPNTVSLIGLGCGLLAGLFYHFYTLPGGALIGFLLMVCWHVMDGADGQLARLTGNYSDLGKLLDGICDYLTFAAVYFGLALAMDAQSGGWVWLVVLLAGLCHAVQAAAYELQRQNYNFWGWGKQSAALPELEKAPAATAWHLRGVAWVSLLYTRLQLWTAGGSSSLHVEFAAMLAAQPAQQTALRAAYRAHFAPVIRRWGVLCANYRTLGIFLAAFLGLPLAYFLFEIVGFSLILVALSEAQKAQNAIFLTSLGQTDGPRQAQMSPLKPPSAQAQQG